MSAYSYYKYSDASCSEFSECIHLNIGEAKKIEHAQYNYIMFACHYDRP